MAGTIFLIICLVLIWFVTSGEDYLTELKRIEEEEDEL